MLFLVNKIVKCLYYPSLFLLFSSFIPFSLLYFLFPLFLSHHYLLLWNTGTRLHLSPVPLPRVRRRGIFFPSPLSPPTCPACPCPPECKEEPHRRLARQPCPRPHSALLVRHVSVLRRHLYIVARVCAPTVVSRAPTTTPRRRGQPCFDDALSLRSWPMHRLVVVLARPSLSARGQKVVWTTARWHSAPQARATGGIVGTPINDV